MSPLVTHAACVARSPGWPPARPEPGRCARGRGSSSGSRLWTASGPGSPPYLPSGRRARSSTADAARCAGPGGTTAHSSNTCIVFASSSAGILRPPMMRLSTLDRDVRRRRTEENEEAFTRSFWKKTPLKKTAISHRLNHYTFRSVLARGDRVALVRPGDGAVRSAPDGDAVRSDHIVEPKVHGGPVSSQGEFVHSG